MGGSGSTAKKQATPAFGAKKVRLPRARCMQNRRQKSLEPDITGLNFLPEEADTTFAAPRSGFGQIQSPDLLQYSVIVVGIDGAGKTTIINHLRPGSTMTPGEQPPTIGCNIENLRHGNVGLTVVDMAGGSRYRNMWQNYYKDAEGIIFVIDSADALRMCDPDPAGEGTRNQLCERCNYPDCPRALQYLFL